MCELCGIIEKLDGNNAKEREKAMVELVNMPIGAIADKVKSMLQEGLNSTKDWRVALKLNSALKEDSDKELVSRSIGKKLLTIATGDRRLSNRQLAEKLLKKIGTQDLRNKMKIVADDETSKKVRKLMQTIPTEDWDSGGIGQRQVLALGKEAIPALMDEFETNKNLNKLEAIAEMLGQLKANETFYELQRKFSLLREWPQPSKEANLRAACLDAIGEIDPIKGFHNFVLGVNDKSSRVQFYSLNGMLMAGMRAVKADNGTVEDDLGKISAEKIVVRVLHGLAGAADNADIHPELIDKAQEFMWVILNEKRQLQIRKEKSGQKTRKLDKTEPKEKLMEQIAKKNLITLPEIKKAGKEFKRKI